MESDIGDENKMAAAATFFGKFDPAEDSSNVHKNFAEFVAAFAYEYKAITKQPPTDADPVTWHGQNKRRQFLKKYVSRNFQRDYEDTIPEDKRTTITFQEMVNSMLERYKPTRNTTLLNYEFHKLKQHDGERFDDFLNRVKQEAYNCDFTCESVSCNIRDILIRDQVVIGTTNDEIRRNALKEQWPLEELCKRGRQLEAASYGAKQINRSNRLEDSSISRISGKYSKKNRLKKHQEEEWHRTRQCENCNGKTCKGGKECFAYGRDCFACGKKGHVKGSNTCRKKRTDREHKDRWKKQASRRVGKESESGQEYSSATSEASETSEGSGSDDESNKINRFSKRISKCRYVAHVRRVAPNQKKTTSKLSRYQVEVIIKEHRVTVFADTGADVSVISLRQAEKLGLPLQKTKMKLRPYGSKTIKCAGSYMGTVMFGTNVANIKFYVVPKDVETLLSGAAAEALGILSLTNAKEKTPAIIHRIESDDSAKILADFPECLSGIGKMKDYKVKFHIDEDIIPVACPPRPIPYHLRTKCEQELEKMEQQGIIEEHHGPAPWVSNIVLSPKEHGVRLTVDMRKPNEAIKATNIPIPRAEDIRAQMAGKKFFSKLDLKSAFHQLELDPESRYMTVFNAGDRLMRYTRLTMGTKPASGELNKALRPLFTSTKGAYVIHDDLIVATEDSEGHDKALREVLQILSINGLTLSTEKCLFKKNKIPFWGMLLSEAGVSPDKSRIEALTTAERPKSKSEVMSFLCMVQSCTEFIPNLARKTTNLRRMTQKSTRFNWTTECQKEFNELKASMHDGVLLNHFNSRDESMIFVDAHKTGLSAILCQRDPKGSTRLISCASRATTAVERRYPQLDLEALSIDFALRRYRQYLAGGPCTVIYTDHKPLISIFGSARKGSVRSDRIQLRHQDINYRVEWRAGKDNPADYLSRHATKFERLPKDMQQESEELEKTIWMLQYSPYTESISMENIIKQTKRDILLQELKTSILQGYISSKSQLLLQNFKGVFDKLTISDSGIILKGEQIVLPKALHELAIQKAHQGGHPGMTSVKRRIRAHFWFPSINELVEKTIKACKPCQLLTGKTTKETMSMQHTPKEAWDKVNIDLFGPMPNSKHVLVVQDQMSRFPAAKIVPSTAAKPVLTALGEVYGAYGNPNTHRTDNGPPFNSKAFEEFSKNRGIHHTKVYEYHPQANPAETFMKPLGKAMKAAALEGQNQERALENLLSGYRNTPHYATGAAPGSMLFRSGYRDEFPRKALTARAVQEAQNREAMLQKQRNIKVNSSVKRKDTEFDRGDMVLNKDQHRRSKFDPIYEETPYRIVDITNKGVVLEREDGVRRRRHVDDIKPMTFTEAAPQTQHIMYDWGTEKDCMQPDQENSGEQIPTEERAKSGEENTNGPPIGDEDFERAPELEERIKEMIRERDLKRSALARSNENRE